MLTFLKKQWPLLLTCLLLPGGLPGMERPLQILVFGDSLTAGYGLEDPPRQAYPALLQEKIDTAGYAAEIIPAGLSGESTAGGLTRINWVLRQPQGWPADVPFQIDILVLALGGNDGLRNVALEDTEANLLGIIARARARYPELRVLLAGVEMPVNWGECYREAFNAVYARVAEQADAVLLPSLLKGIGDDPGLMQPDRIHPTVEGHQKMAALVWAKLEPMLANLSK